MDLERSQRPTLTNFETRRPATLRCRSIRRSVCIALILCNLQFQNPAELPLKRLDRMIRLDCCDTSAAGLLDQASIEHGQACLQASGSTGETQERRLTLSTLSMVGHHVYRERPPNGNASQCVSTPSTTTGVFMTKTTPPCQRTRHRTDTQILHPAKCHGAAIRDSAWGGRM